MEIIFKIMKHLYCTSDQYKASLLNKSIYYFKTPVMENDFLVLRQSLLNL